MFTYINLVYWLLALASLIAWARFCAFMSEDITKNLVDQPELPWKLGAAGVMLLMLVMYLVMPSFWIALPVNAVIAGGMIAAFWVIRESKRHWARRGICFAVRSRRQGRPSSRMEERKNSRQVQLSYVRHDNSAMPLPKADDPLASGLGTADQIVIQALMRRAEMVELAPHQNGYGLALITDGDACGAAGGWIGPRRRRRFRRSRYWQVCRRKNAGGRRRGSFAPRTRKV